MARYASFASHERSRLRICAALCLMAVFLFVDAPCVALAGKVKITVTGVVTSGIDVTGVFGPKNSALAGKDYTQVFIVDDTKGTGTIVTAGNPPPASSIAASMGSNPVMATITIGGGTVSYGVKPTSVPPNSYVIRSTSMMSISTGGED